MLLNLSKQHSDAAADDNINNNKLHAKFSAKVDTLIPIATP
jgi:hypothetical protein